MGQGNPSDTPGGIHRGGGGYRIDTPSKCSEFAFLIKVAQCNQCLLEMMHKLAEFGALDRVGMEERNRPLDAKVFDPTWQGFIVGLHAWRA
jgi:hypothetical protein